MKQAIISYKAHVEAQPKVCPNLAKVVKSVEYLLKADPIATARSVLGEPYKDYTFYRRNPTHCCLWIHSARTAFHQDAMTYAANPGGIMTTTQLYHALRQNELVKEEWKDLQTLWDTQGNATYFIGEPPKDFEGHYRNYCMSLGMSLTNWVSNKRDTKTKENKNNGRVMRWQGPVSSWIASRIATNGDQRLLSAEGIEEKIDTVTKDGTPVPSNTTPNQQASIINKLALTIEAEIPALKFDYFAMHDQCWAYMERLKEAFDPIISEKSGKQWSAHKQNLPFVVGFVFSTAAERKDIETKGVPSGELLNIAVGVMNDFLKEGGGNVIVGKERKI
jgi:hypothetical protein